MFFGKVLKPFALMQWILIKIKRDLLLSVKSTPHIPGTAFGAVDKVCPQSYIAPLIAVCPIIKGVTVKGCIGFVQCS